MKRLIALSVVAAFLLAIPVSHLLLGKGHVPAHKDQVCHNGEVETVGSPAVPAHLNHGDCFIDKMTLIPPLFAGDACNPTDHCD